MVGSPRRALSRADAAPDGRGIAGRRIAAHDQSLELMRVQARGRVTPSVGHQRNRPRDSRL
jgi:hypothetical protein